MINKLLFILLLFLFTSLSSNAQVTYPTWEWAVTDSSVLVGDWCMFEHHFYTVGNNFTRWDTNGNKLLTNHLVQGKQLIFDNHQHAFVLGTMTVDSLVFPNTTLHKQGMSDVLIYKLDTLGNILWVKNLGGPLGDDCNQFCIDYQDNLYLTGYLQGTNGIHKLDSSGSFLWSKEIHDTLGSYYENRYLAYSPFDSTIVIGGQFRTTLTIDTLTINNIYPPSATNKPTDNYLLKLNLNGQAKLLKDIAFAWYWSDGFYDLAVKPSTGDIFCVIWWNTIGGQIISFQKFSADLTPGCSSIMLSGAQFSYDMHSISFDQDSLVGLLYHSPTEPYVFKIFNSQQCSLIKTYDATQPIVPLHDQRLLFENGHIYFYGGWNSYTFYKMGIAPLSINPTPDFNVCSNNPNLTFNPIVIGGNPPFTFSWQPTTGVSNPNVLNPIFTINSSASYTLTVTDSLGYMAKDTINFTYYPSPNDSITSTSNLFPCYGDSSTIVLHCANISLQNQWYKNYVLIENDADSIMASANNTYMLKTIDPISGCYVDRFQSIYYHPQIPTIIANSNNITLPDDTCFSPIDIQYQNYSNFTAYQKYWLKDGMTIASQTPTISVSTPGQYVLKIIDYGCDLEDTITFLPSTIDSTSLTICSGQLPYAWNGQSITSSGQYNYVSLGTNGCDSTSILNLTIDSLSPPINWNGIYLSTSSSFVTYQWLLNGNMINGAMDSTYTPTQNGNYAVIVSNNNGCSDTTSVYNYMVTSASNPLFTITPNPTRNLSTIYFKQEFSGTVQVMDSRGQTLGTYVLEKVQSKNLDVSHYANGVYLIKVSGEHENEVMKLRVDRD